MIQRVTKWSNGYGMYFDTEQEAKDWELKWSKLSELETLVRENGTWCHSPRPHESAELIYRHWKKLQEIMK